MSLPEYGGRKLPAGGALFRMVSTAAVSSCGRIPPSGRLIVETSEAGFEIVSGFEGETFKATLRCAL